MMVATNIPGGWFSSVSYADRIMSWGASLMSLTTTVSTWILFKPPLSVATTPTVKLGESSKFSGAKV